MTGAYRLLSDRMFVGRDRELGELRGALSDAAAGRGGLFLLVGEPGIGKTTLAETLSAEARAAGFRVYWGRCWEGGGAPPYWPWVQVLRAYVRESDPQTIASQLRASGHALAQIAPELASLLPEVGALQKIEGEEARFAVFDVASTFLRNVAEARPLLLVFDDLHAADRVSLLLLHFAARALREAPVLLLGTYRDVEVGLDPATARLVGELAREGTKIPLRGLAREAVARLIDEATGVKASAELVAAVHEASGGNPFFVDELVRVLAAEGRLAEGKPPAPGLRLPEGVRQAIARRLDQLSEDARELLAVASVAGREFTVGLLEQVSGRPRGEVLELLGEAVAAGLVIDVAPAAGRYGFAHALVRETVYAGLGPTRRLELHRRVGEALERLYEDDPEPHLAELAHHFIEAAQLGDADKAVAYAERAARRATAQLAYEEAAGHYERALGALDLQAEPDDGARRCELLLALGDVRMKAGQTAGAREALSQAAELARRLDTPVELARAALTRAAPYAEAGFGDQLRAPLLEEALARLPGEDNQSRARLLARLAPEIFWSHDFARADAVSAEAVEMARRLADDDTLAEALDCRHYAIMGPDTLEERLVVAEELVRLADKLGDIRLRLRGRLWRIHDLLELGNMAAVDADIAEHVRLADALRQPGHLWMAGYLRAMRTLLEGRLDEGIRQATEAFAIGQRTGIADAVVLYYCAAMLPVCRHRGGVGELEGPITTIAELHRDRAPGVRVLMAMIYKLADRRDDARREYERFAARGFDLPRDHNWLSSLWTLAGLCAAFDDAPRARLLYDLMRPYATRFVTVGFAAGCMGAAARPLARLATTMSRYREAQDHFEAALELNRRIGARGHVAETQAEYAAMLLARAEPGDRDRARELLQAAQATAGELGLTTIAERCSELASGTGAERPPAAPRAPVEAVFRPEGDYWTISYRTAAFRLRDTKGLRLIALLLARPGDELPAIELVGILEGQAEATDLGDAGEMLDEQAKRAYRQRLRAMEEELEEATSLNDLGRQARARQEIDFLTEELARAIGLGGRDRRAASASERARISMTNRIRDAIDKISREDPALAHHLQATIRTGRLCSYQPGPEPGVIWKL